MEIILGIIYLFAGAVEPRALLTLGAILNAAAMMIAFPLILALNLKLPRNIRPSLFRRLAMISAFLFFAYFVYQTFISAL